MCLLKFLSHNIVKSLYNYFLKKEFCHNINNKLLKIESYKNIVTKYISDLKIFYNVLVFYIIDALP